MSRSSELWARIDAQVPVAIERGSLHRIDTQASIVAEGGVDFVVRRAVQAMRPKAEGARRKEDPFADPEPDLFVQDLTRTHYALLNKYNVVERHLLVVTRADIDQDVPLDAADFEALAIAMHGEPVLGFYNGGTAAGASQRHKHLQVVRLPLAPSRAIPMEALVDSARLDTLGIEHAFLRLDPREDERARARSLLAGFLAAARRIRLEARPYNLLVARDWMLLVPRRQGSFGSIPVNALAFAGALFVRTDEELATVLRLGPTAILRGVAHPKDSS